jgi:hypothetical protein
VKAAGCGGEGPQFATLERCQIRRLGPVMRAQQTADKRGDSHMAYYAPTTKRAWPGIGLVPLIHIVVGVIVAVTHHYWAHLQTIKQIGSALLATVLWPLILLGINLHIH